MRRGAPWSFESGMIPYRRGVGSVEVATHQRLPKAVCRDAPKRTQATKRMRELTRAAQNTTGVVA